MPIRNVHTIMLLPWRTSTIPVQAQMEPELSEEAARIGEIWRRYYGMAQQHFTVVLQSQPDEPNVVEGSLVEVPAEHESKEGTAHTP